MINDGRTGRRRNFDGWVAPRYQKRRLGGRVSIWVPHVSHLRHGITLQAHISKSRCEALRPHIIYAMIGSRLLYLLAALVIIFTRIVSVAQVSSGSNPVVQPPPLPLTSQIKKTIAFLSTTCLHDYSAEADALSIESLQKMPIQQEFTIAQQLIALTLRLQNVRQSMAKLTADDIAHLKQNVALTDSSAIAAEALWRAQVLVKMTSLTAEDIASLKPEEIPLIPSNEFLGTGFFVKVSDGRIKGPEGVDKANLGFTYLVTNRHVVQPGVEKGKPCQVLGSAIVLNRKPDTTHSSLYAETSRIDKILKWTYSDDDSVDLAVSGIGVPPDLYDYVTIPTIQFITDEEVQKKIVVEETRCYSPDYSFNRSVKFID
jgi:hypothetical protein